MAANSNWPIRCAFAHMSVQRHLLDMSAALPKNRMKTNTTHTKSREVNAKMICKNWKLRSHISQERGWEVLWVETDQPIGMDRFCQTVLTIVKANEWTWFVGRQNYNLLVFNVDRHCFGYNVVCLQRMPLCNPTQFF